MSRTNNIDSAAFRSSAEFFLLTELAEELMPERQTEFMALFHEHFVIMRSADTLVQIRNGHVVLIDKIYGEIKKNIKARNDMKLIYEKGDEHDLPKIHIHKT